MKIPNPAIRLPQWNWLRSFDLWRVKHGILTGRWTQAQIDDQRQRAAQRAIELRKYME